MLELSADIKTPKWFTHESGWVSSFCFQTWQQVSYLTDLDIVVGLSMWKDDPEFLGRIFMQQADRLGFSMEEKQEIFQGITKQNIMSLIQFNMHNEWSDPINSEKLGSMQLSKLPQTIENYDALLTCLFHTPWIIEVYPARADEVVHIYTVLHHEINHLLMMALYIFRSKQKNVPLEQTIQKCTSWGFNEITETLAWLDGGQVPMNISIVDNRRIAQYVGWQEWGKYNRADSYEMAKLRSYRIHTLQIKIHNLSDTTAEQYKLWCKTIREIVFAGIDQSEYLQLIDAYLDTVSSPQQARDQLLNFH
jgi:hypothetical protein